MAEFYKSKVPRNPLWNYGGPNWKLSRSKIDLFKECRRCFYLDNKLGLARPKGPSFTLNVAVDALLKKEFDTHRVAKSAHPLMKQYGVDAIPFAHKNLEIWRENFTGIQYFHEPTGFTVSGAVDDIWVNNDEELIVVDYKATSKEGKMETLDDTKWNEQYRRQMEVYQWLLRQIGFKVSDTGYFVYVNGRKDLEAFDGKLEFDVTLISHTGKDDWIEKTLLQIKDCLDDDRIPDYDSNCDHCIYTKTLGNILRAQAGLQKSANAAAEIVKEEVEVTVKKKTVKKVKNDDNGVATESGINSLFG